MFRHSFWVADVIYVADAMWHSCIAQLDLSLNGERLSPILYWRDRETEAIDIPTMQQTHACPIEAWSPSVCFRNTLKSRPPNIRVSTQIEAVTSLR